MYPSGSRSTRNLKAIAFQTEEYWFKTFIFTNVKRWKIDGNISDSEGNILRFPMRFCMDLCTQQVLEVREISRHLLFRRRNTTSKRSGVQLAPQLLRDTERTYLGPEHSYLTARSNQRRNYFESQRVQTQRPQTVLERPEVISAVITSGNRGNQFGTRKRPFNDPK